MIEDDIIVLESHYSYIFRVNSLESS